MVNVSSQVPVISAVNRFSTLIRISVTAFPFTKKTILLIFHVAVLEINNLQISAKMPVMFIIADISK